MTKDEVVSAYLKAEKERIIRILDVDEQIEAAILHGWTQAQAEMLRLARGKANKLITGAPFIKLSDLEAIAKMEAE